MATNRGLYGPKIITETIVADQTPVFGSWFTALGRHFQFGQLYQSAWGKAIGGYRVGRSEAAGNTLRTQYNRSSASGTFNGGGEDGFLMADVAQGVKIYGSTAVSGAFSLGKWGPVAAEHHWCKANDASWPDFAFVSYSKANDANWSETRVEYFMGLVDAFGGAALLFEAAAQHQAFWKVAGGVATPTVKDNTGSTTGTTLSGLAGFVEFGIVIMNSSTPRSIDFYINGDLIHSFFTPASEKWPTALLMPAFEIQSIAGGVAGEEMFNSMFFSALSDKELP